ncbi:hypothetical protein RIF29_15250 [Crotalaria pallida]|uniref:Uncharacterized protein n=1 Tax=Crotalaria pallida TaxID=3830 RepID=A0AAN9FD66_CROPI
MGLIERKIEKLIRVALEEVEYILRKVNIHVHSSPDNHPSPIKTMAGGRTFFHYGADKYFASIANVSL